MLRFVVCGVSVYVAFKAYNWQRIWGTWLFGFIAVLFNPLILIHLSREIWKRIDVICGDCSSFTEQITVKVFNYNDLWRFNITNRGFRPTVVTDSNLDMGFCRYIVASTDCLPGSVLCNLATVSICGILFIVIAIMFNKPVKNCAPDKKANKQSKGSRNVEVSKTFSTPAGRWW